VLLTNDSFSGSGIVLCEILDNANVELYWRLAFEEPGFQVLGANVYRHSCVCDSDPSILFRIQHPVAQKASRTNAVLGRLTCTKWELKREGCQGEQRHSSQLFGAFLNPLEEHIPHRHCLSRQLVGLITIGAVTMGASSNPKTIAW
jgi:hypothetical protein